jgi:hypothetical protein
MEDDEARRAVAHCAEDAGAQYDAGSSAERRHDDDSAGAARDDDDSYVTR